MTTLARLPLVNSHPLWTVAQRIGLVLTFALVAALVIWPAPTLHLLWDMVIPLFPALFLINPMIWRNVCPLASLNERRVETRNLAAPSPEFLRVGWIVGIVLFALLVPARRVLFNEDGLALAATIAMVAALAHASGFVLSRRAGFCNSICPVLPVEKLYGQAPLVPIGSSRCVSCDRCTPSACIDLAGRKSAVQSARGERGAPWLGSPFALFACAFPGFVIGYFSTQNGDLATLTQVYVHIAQGAAISLAVSASIVSLARVRANTALIALGGVAAGAYYWYAAPKLAEAYGGNALAGTITQWVALAFVGLWLWRALRREYA